MLIGASVHRDEILRSRLIVFHRLRGAWAIVHAAIASGGERDHFLSCGLNTGVKIPR